MKMYGKKRTLTFYQRVWVTIGILIGYRLLSHIPLPFVNAQYVQAMIETNGSLNMLNTLTGGNLESMSVVALGITPYITASIVLQLFGVCFPRLAQLQKEGSTGQKKMKRITTVVAVLLGGVQSIGMMVGYGSRGMLSSYAWYTILIPTVILIAGVFLLSFLGQYITDHLFGNGISLILTVGIVCSYPGDASDLFSALTGADALIWKIVFAVLGVLAIVALFGFSVWLMYCEKRIHITYNGKLAMDGPAARQESVIPLKLVGGSVVPVIFASSILTIPGLIQSFFGTDIAWLHVFNTNYWLFPEEPWASLGMVLYFAMIIGFSYYYQALNLNEKDLAQQLKKQGGVIEGVRPGRPTELYLHRQMRYLTLLGGLGLCVIAFVPIVVSATLNLGKLSFLGTSIIITVSVLMETGKKFLAERKGLSYRDADSFLGIQRPALLLKNTKKGVRR